MLQRVSPTQRTSMESTIAEFKTRLESLESEEQQRQSQEIEAEQRLRVEEAKFSELRDQLDRLDKVLESASR